ncbi:steryl acetyl hydrolase [archaeon]|nr:MAG: steryl acetyl hydrolase [archaeon]
MPPTLLYIHGGGFVGSFWAQDRIMLSKWAANSREPLNIVFPHYTLAPEARFPDALNELLYTYLWLQRRCAAIAVAGESAGGNLATALLLRLIAIEAPRPRGLVLAYPALNLNPSPSPSRSLHMNDALVPISLLLRLAQAYMPPAPEDAADDNSSRSGRHIDESAPVTESGGCASLPIANVAATSTEDVLEVADAAEDDLPSAAPPNPLVGQFHITDNFFVHPLYAPDALLQYVLCTRDCGSLAAPLPHAYPRGAHFAPLVCCAGTSLRRTSLWAGWTPCWMTRLISIRACVV